jgi:hypothetical protein
MPIPLNSIRLGWCYATALDDVRKVIDISGRSVTYVVRGKLAFPTWDKNQWRTTTKEAFTYEVVGEVPCDWRPLDLEEGSRETQTTKRGRWRFPAAQ